MNFNAHLLQSPFKSSNDDFTNNMMFYCTNESQNSWCVQKKVWTLNLVEIKMSNITLFISSLNHLCIRLYNKVLKMDWSYILDAPDVFLVLFKFWHIIITINYDQKFGQIQDISIVYTLSTNF